MIILFADTTVLVLIIYTQAVHIMKPFCFISVFLWQEQTTGVWIACFPFPIIRNINDVDVWGLFPCHLIFSIVIDVCWDGMGQYMWCIQQWFPKPQLSPVVTKDKLLALKFSGQLYRFLHNVSLHLCRAQDSWQPKLLLHIVCYLWKLKLAKCWS